MYADNVANFLPDQLGFIVLSNMFLHELCIQTLRIRWQVPISEGRPHILTRLSLTLFASLVFLNGAGNLALYRIFSLGKIYQFAKVDWLHSNTHTHTSTSSKQGEYYFTLLCFSLFQSRS